MNNDYLWDKTGHDPEIAELENALQGLAYRETQPPALPMLPELPAKVVAFPAKPATRFFRYAMAAAACLLFVALSFGIWFNLSRDAANEGDEIVAKGPFTEDKVLMAPEKIPGTNLIKESAVSPIEKPSSFLKRANITNKTILPGAHKIKRPSAPKVITLTKEEEYAYDQLKLALSITGSKLKLIKNKVENADARDPEAGGGR